MVDISREGRDNTVVLSTRGALIKRHKGIISVTKLSNYTFWISFQVAEEVEKETRQQSKSSKWFAFRAGRITASNAKAVCRTSVTTPSRSLVKRVCYPEATQFWSAPTSWGQQHEETARSAYMSVSKDIHAKFQCSVSGLHISTKYHFLAATPDGVLNCSCCGKGVLEIKCPYNGRERTVRELAASDSACLSTVDGTVMLKKEHSYYYQVQMQMLVCEVGYCDFVLWTTKDFIVLSMCKRMLDRCELYFKVVLLPELCFSHWTRSSDADGQDQEQGSDSSASEEVYCVCRGPESGSMIMCDSKTCKHVWFHYKCVNLSRAPKAKKWFCPSCLEKNKKA